MSVSRRSVLGQAAAGTGTLALTGRSSGTATADQASAADAETTADGARRLGLIGIGVRSGSVQEVEAGLAGRGGGTGAAAGPGPAPPPRRLGDPPRRRSAADITPAAGANASPPALGPSPDGVPARGAVMRTSRLRCVPGRNRNVLSLHHFTRCLARWRSRRPVHQTCEESRTPSRCATGSAADRGHPLRRPGRRPQSRRSVSVPTDRHAFRSPVPRPQSCPSDAS